MNRLLRLSLLSILSSLFLSAANPPMQRAYGWCEQGAHTVTTGAVASATRVQQSYPGCGVKVYVSGSSGVSSGAYQSGGTISGSNGQTCTLTLTGGATATVPLNNTNAINPGHALTITSSGRGYSSAPTSATLSSGTATCSGTAVVTTTLSAAPASLFSDALGTIPLANPFQANQYGYWFFYTTGRVDVQISGTGLPIPFTFGDILTNDPHTALQCGAYGDGIHDDTVPIQSCLTRYAGQTIDGQGLTYAVSTLLIPSNTTFQNFKLFALASGVQYQSPVTIDGISIAKTNITIRNVVVDGNRVNQTGMSVQAAENGGRNCFRLVGNVSQVVIDNVQGRYCGTDGIELFSYSAPASDYDSALRFHDITISNSVFKYNRRHGSSADSLYNVTYQNVVFEYNGLDMAEIQTLYSASPSNDSFYDWVAGTYTSVAACNGGSTSGACGARAADNTVYGNGIDVEGYGVGSGINGLSLIGIQGAHNARGSIVFVDSAIQTASGFQPRRNIRLIGIYADSGLHAQIGANPYSIGWTSSIENTALTPRLYQNIVLADSIMNDWGSCRSCANITLTNTYINSSIGVSFSFINVDSYLMLANNTAGKYPFVSSSTGTAFTQTDAGYGMYDANGNLVFKLTTAGIPVVQPPSGLDAVLYLDSIGAQASALALESSGALKWSLGKQVDNTFFLYDAANARDALRISGNTMSFNPAGAAGFKFGFGTSAPNSTISLLGSVSASVSGKAINYSLSVSDYVIICNTGAGALVMTLPTAVGVTGRIYGVKRDSGGNACTVATTGGQTIDGSATYSLSSVYSRVFVMSDGANWTVLSN